jgi:hypothetical protein
MNTNYQIHAVWSNEQIAEWQNELLQVLTPENIAFWLASKSEDEVIGFAANEDHCPISNYLQEKVPHLNCGVGLHQIVCRIPSRLFNHGQFKGIEIQDIYYLGKYRGEEMPEWLTEYIEAIDNKFYRQTLPYKLCGADVWKKTYKDYDFYVLASDALDLLCTICPQVMEVAA